MISDYPKFKKAELKFTNYVNSGLHDQYGFRILRDNGQILNKVEQSMVELAKVIIFQDVSIRRLNAELPDLFASTRPKRMLEMYLSPTSNRHNNLGYGELKPFLCEKKIVQYALRGNVVKVQGKFFDAFILMGWGGAD